MQMFKYVIASTVLALITSACGSDSINQKKESISDDHYSKVISVNKPPQLVGCWQLSKFGFSLKDIDNESKWVAEKNGALLVLRDDGKFMKWFGDYMDVGTFEIHNDSLFLDRKGGDEIDAFKLDTLTPSEMIITSENAFVPIEKYKRLSEKSYSIWKAKF